VPVAWNGQAAYAAAGQWVARFDGLAGGSPSQVQALQGQLDTTGLDLHVVRPLGGSGLVLLQGPAGLTADQLQVLVRVPGYRYAEPNFYEPNPLLDTIPNDTYFDLDWGLHNTGQWINGQTGIAGDDVSAAQAWDYTTGSTKVTIADIDTGVDYDHPDLYQNIWINQAEIPPSRLQNLVDVDGDGLITFYDLNNPVNQGPGKITDVNADGRIDAQDILAPMVLDAQGQDTGMGGWAYPGNTQDGDTAHPNDFVGWNFVANTNRPFDDNSHGTHTSGTIAAQGNNGIGVAGVNWTAQLMCVKWINGGGQGFTADAISSVLYSVNHGARVSSNSWHVFEDAQALYDAINTARSAGDLFVAAAGNDGVNTDARPNWPSIYVANNHWGVGLDNIVSVAATDNRDGVASFSNFGLQTVNLGGPGVDVYSTFPNNGYGLDSGTSMATPHVAGAAALAMSIAPAASYQVIRQAIFDSVDPIAALARNGRHPVSTGGRLNVLRLVQEFATAGPVVRAMSPSGDSTFPPVDHVRFTFNEPVDPTTFTFDQVDSFTDPLGNAIPVADIEPVPGSNNTQFDVTFNALTLAGPYTMVIGPNILDPAGNPMDQNHNNIPGEVPDDEYTARFTIQPPAVVSTTLTGTFDRQTVDHGRITFNTPVDPYNFPPDQISILDQGGNPVTVTSVTPVDPTNKQYDVTFDPQSALGTYTVTVGPNLIDGYGNPMAAPFTSQFSIIEEHLVNGGFETGNFNGWVRTGNTADTFVGAHAHRGTYAANLGPVGSVLEFLTQRFPTTPGTSYTLSYWLSNDAGTPNRFEAYIDGTLVAGSQLLNVGALAYTNFVFTFVANGAMTELKFGIREDPAYFYLDDVSVSPTPTPRPHGGGGSPAHAPVAALPVPILADSDVLPAPARGGGYPETRLFPAAPGAPAVGSAGGPASAAAARARLLAQLFAGLQTGAVPGSVPPYAVRADADNNPPALDRPGDSPWLL
jgi:subtilisin family serine protease